jgi:DNA-binding transcriptional regulator YiaG
MEEELAVRVKQIRIKLKLSQRAFAKQVGATFVSIYKWENNKSKPHPMFMKKIEELNEKDNCGNSCL